MASRSHYKDWPNTQGFDVSYQELKPTELEIVGTIPAYCAGVLFRNGLGPREIQTSTGGTFKVSHWFDSLSQVHRFQIHSPTPDHPHVRVTHNSRLTCDGVIRRIQRTGYRGEITFGAKYDPCMTLFQKAQAFFAPNPKDSADGANVNVTLSVNFPGLAPTGAKDGKPAEKTGIRTLCNKTDNSLMQMLEPTTLEPIGLAEQSVLHPQLKGQLSASHAKTDPVTGDVFNYNLEMGPNATYRIFMVSPSSGKTHILATIKYPAAYIHSFFLTENYVILCVWSSHFRKGGLSMLFNHNFVDTMANYTTSTPAKWFVVDRKPGGAGLIATYESDAFFAFHSINAYEEMSTTDPSKIDIVADLCAYDGLDILKRFYMKNLMSDSPDAGQSSGWSHANSQADFRRYRLGSLSKSSNAEKQKATMEFSVGKGMGLCPELPTINPRFKCKKHRFVYGVTASGKSSFLDGLVKFDVMTRTSVHWSEHAQTPGEMIFIPDPNNQDEDAGTLLCVILDGIAGKSYLLALDAKNMTEIGRANVNSVVGFGFHGVHVPETNL